VISSRSPRRRLSALALLLTLAALLVSACGSSSQSNAPAADAHGTVNGQAVTDLYGALPKGGTPTGSGTITMGQISGDTPTYVFPIIPDANATDGTGFLVDQLFIPLYNAQVGGVLKVNYATSAALPPRFSDGGRRVTIHIRPGYKWSDGSPVTSTDVLFDLALLRAATRQSAANWDQYTPGLLPDNVKTATAPNPSTLVLTFKRAYNQQSPCRSPSGTSRPRTVPRSTGAFRRTPPGSTGTSTSRLRTSPRSPPTRCGRPWTVPSA
jgi:peptide/nickel transport system substrate-binding protein